MTDCTHARQPGMLAFPSAGCRQGSASGMSGEKPKKKAFYLVRMKPLKEPASTTNNNVSFVIQYHIGKEIKHICSNCSRGEEARDGECCDPVGVGARQGSACAARGCADMCALPSEPGMLGLLLHRSQAKRKGGAGGMRWASIQPVDQGDAKRDRSLHLPQKLCANS